MFIVSRKAEVATANVQHLGEGTIGEEARLIINYEAKWNCLYPNSTRQSAKQMGNRRYADLEKGAHNMNT